MYVYRSETKCRQRTAMPVFASLIICASPKRSNSFRRMADARENNNPMGNNWNRIADERGHS